jgi:hypothetical protein
LVSEVKESDLFVGLYAHRYGFVPPDARASVTELEYERAVELKKPVFAFIVDDDFDWKPSFIEGEPGHTRLVAFKNRLSASHIIERFTSPTDLAFKVSTSVSNYGIFQNSNWRSTFHLPRRHKLSDQRTLLCCTQASGHRKQTRDSAMGADITNSRSL